MAAASPPRASRGCACACTSHFVYVCAHACSALWALCAGAPVRACTCVLCVWQGGAETFWHGPPADGGWARGLGGGGLGDWEQSLSGDGRAGPEREPWRRLEVSWERPRRQRTAAPWQRHGNAHKALAYLAPPPTPAPVARWLTAPGEGAGLSGLGWGWGCTPWPLGAPCPSSLGLLLTAAHPWMLGPARGNSVSCSLEGRDGAQKCPAPSRCPATQVPSPSPGGLWSQGLLKTFGAPQKRQGSSCCCGDSKLRSSLILHHRPRVKAPSVGGGS